MKKSEVQQIVKESLKTAIVEEGWWDDMMNAAYMTGKFVRGGVARGARNALVGAAGGMTLGMILTVMDLVDPTAIITYGAIGGLGGFAQGFVTGGMHGYRTQKSIANMEHEKQIQKLIDVTNKRDQLFLKAANGEKVGEAIKKLTDDQRKVQKEASRLIVDAKKLGIVDKREYEIFDGLAKAAREGKLTYHRVDGR